MQFVVKNNDLRNIYKNREKYISKVEKKIIIFGI